MAKTFDAVLASEDFVPVVVCGKQRRLQRRLAARAQHQSSKAIVLGWTDQMPELMGAADALVENAGGLTSLEAMAAGLPVVTFRPIAGHGRENSRLMEAAGVTRRADTADELLAALEEVATPGLARQRQIAAARAMLAGDAADDVVALADAGAPVRVPAPRVRSAARITVKVAAVATAAAIVPIALDTGASFAATKGVGVAHAAKPAQDVAYMAVRLGPEQLQDPAVIDQVELLHASAVLDSRTAGANADAVRSLTNRGIDVENGGSGRRIDLPWRRAEVDVVKTRRSMQDLTGQAVPVFVPARHIDGIDLMWCRGSHAKPVVPNRVLDPAEHDPVTLTARHTYVVEATNSSNADVVAYLQRVEARLAELHLDGAPLADLH